jgi:hypothetical protein
MPIKKVSYDFHQSFIDESIKYLEYEAKKNSFNKIVPSIDMSCEEYQGFLYYAKPYELELDVVSQDTYYKICGTLNLPLPKPNFPTSRRALL